MTSFFNQKKKQKQPPLPPPHTNDHSQTLQMTLHTLDELDSTLTAHHNKNNLSQPEGAIEITTTAVLNGSKAYVDSNTQHTPRYRTTIKKIKTIHQPITN
jgi:hypothetical protein